MGFLVANGVESMGTILELIESQLGNQLIVGSIEFSLEKLKSAVEKAEAAKLKALQTVAIKTIEKKTLAAKWWIKAQADLFNESIVSFKDFVQMKYKEIKVAKQLMDTRVLLNEFDEILNVIKNSQYGIKSAAEIHPRVYETNMACEGLVNTVCSMESSLNKLEEQYEGILKSKVEKTIDKLNSLLQDTIDPELLLLSDNIEVPQGKIMELQKVFEKEAGKLEELKNSCKFLDFDIVIDSTVVSQIEMSLKYRSMLWELIRDIKKLKSDISHLEINQVKVDELDKFIKQKNKNLKSLIKHLPECASLAHASKELKSIEELSPFYKSALSPFLKESHFEELLKIYEQITDKSKAETIIKGEATWSQINELNIAKVRQDVIGVAVKAYHEDNLQSMLKELKAKWSKINIPFMALPHNPDIYGFADLRPLIYDLEDGLHTLGKLLANKYVGIILKETEDYQKLLTKVHESLSRLNSIQQKFVFFDALFMSPDMKKQLPTDGVAFDNAAKIFLGMIKKIEAKSTVLTVHRLPQFEDNMGKMQQAFEGLEKNLDRHLSMKRQKFTRLYLMSDSELLDMLSNFYKNVNVFNQHLSKMFDSVAGIRVVEDGGDVHINGIYSDNQETIAFPDIAFHSKGSLEDVMIELLAVMQAKVKESIFKKFDDLLDGTRMVDLEKFDLERFTKDSVMQSTLVSIDCYLGQLLINSIGKGDDGFLESVLETCLVSKLELSRHPKNRVYSWI
jgi:hypothetical protein